MIHHVAHGSGEPLVALHGFTVDHRMMVPLLEPLFDSSSRWRSLGERRGVERVYPDFPGMGRSPGDGIDSAADVVDAVDAWLDEVVGDRRFRVVGVSFGGLVARELVRRRPDQVAGMALIAPVAVAERELRTLPAVTPLRDDVFWGTLSEEERKDFGAVAYLQDAPHHAVFTEQIVPGLRAGDPEALGRIAANYSLGEIETGPWDAPTTIICGREDDTVGWRDQVDLLERYSRATYAVLDGAGHNVHLERPEAVRGLLEEWLERG
ncbi:alpha/beta fold hydrolase [Mariniluteicoccus flavus]